MTRAPRHPSPHASAMLPVDALRATGHTVATTRQLLRAGATPDQLTLAVRSGDLVRVRRGHYAAPGIDDAVGRAARVGGRLTCISALRRHGIWVPDDPFPHVAVAPNAARLRSPGNRFVRLSELNRDGITLHWLEPVADDESTQHEVSCVDAIRHAVRCQPWYLGVALLDSALYTRQLHNWQLDSVFDGQPAHVRELRSRIDSRCESGIETIVRLLLEELGIPFEVQVPFAGVGDVDFVVAGCVVIETDGKLGHVGDTGQLRDYDRDVVLARRGYAVLRFNYSQVMYRRAEVMDAIVTALRQHRRYAG